MLGVMSAELPRRAQRRSVALPAQYRTTSALRDCGRISDISTQGCCVTAGDLLFRVGSHVVIRPDGMEAVGGTVRWIARNFAGIEFDRSIHAPVLEHLVQMHQSDAEVLLSRD
jgi:hypothetical protein